jgi:hypothetical protein
LGGRQGVDERIMLRELLRRLDMMVILENRLDALVRLHTPLPPAKIGGANDPLGGRNNLRPESYYGPQCRLSAQLRKYRLRPREMACGDGVGPIVRRLTAGGDSHERTRLWSKLPASRQNTGKYIESSPATHPAAAKTSFESKRYRPNSLRRITGNSCPLNRQLKRRIREGF